ncbi:MAG TPA: hypothetical protein VIT65_22395 [Microlunatus sp.]
MSDNTALPTGIDLSLTMSVDDLRAMPSPLEYDPNTMRILEREQTALSLAPMVAFFRRYPDDMLPIVTHRVMALSLDFRVYPITQSTQQVVDEIWAYLMRSNPRLVSLGWNQLSTVQQAFLVNSHLLPLEFKSAEFMATRPADDFALVMTEGISWELTS